MTPDDTCALCGKKDKLLALPFLIKNAAKAGLEIDKKARYLHMECGNALGKMIRDKHHRVPYNRPELQESNPGTASGDTEPMAIRPPKARKTTGE